MADFFPQTKISDPNKVFGRGEGLSILEDNAKSLAQIQIIGARRFGKTTISLCLESLLRKDETSNVYPIYTDVKTSRVKGTANFYRYLTAMLVKRLCEDQIFTEEKSFGLVTITPSIEYIENYTRLKDSLDDYQPDIFIKVASHFAEKMGKTILVIFDEYEYLAKSTFESLDGFMPLREFSTDTLDSGLRPFIFWLVGARPWGHFVKSNQLSNVEVIGGSGEFNNVELEFYMNPISKSDFLEFWETRCEDYYSGCEDEDSLNEKSIILSYGESVYNAVSGIPFYASAIAKCIKTDKKLPDYTCIKSHLEEALRIFDESTIKLLRKLCTPQFTKETEDYDLLSSYGFICCDDEGKASVSMGYLRDYLIRTIKSDDPKSSPVQSSTRKEDNVKQLVENIDVLIEYINSTCSNKKRPPIFESTLEERKLRVSMNHVCTKESEFGEFLETLVKVYYERSKALDPALGASIPGFRLAELENGKAKYKGRKFFKVLEPLRTYYGAHLKDKVERKNSYQLDLGDALFQLQGHRNEPDCPEAWYKLQVKMLDFFIIELQYIKNLVCKLP